MTNKMNSQESALDSQIISPSDALQLLKEGNDRFVNMHRLADPGVSAEIRISLTEGQHPYATILCCSDSRVPPEIVFDEGLGHLFIVRVAGNVIDPVTLGSIEYATLHSTSRLIIVMGHQHCGAVTAATEVVENHHGVETSDIMDLIYRIFPAVHRAIKLVGEDDEPKLIEAAIRANVRLVVEQIIRRSAALREMTETGEVQIVGSYYSLDTGEVEFFD